MEIAVEILKAELIQAMAANQREVVTELRRAIMLLNRNLFHQKIMGADPTNTLYAA
jgi:hypothetical protein